MTLGAALKSYRERHSLTQRELARKLRIPVRSIQNYEENGAIPNLSRRRKILAFLAREHAKAAA